jgi:hypothetical protein
LGRLKLLLNADGLGEHTVRSVTVIDQVEMEARAHGGREQIGKIQLDNPIDKVQCQTAKVHPP